MPGLIEIDTGLIEVDTGLTWLMGGIGGAGLTNADSLVPSYQMITEGPPSLQMITEITMLHMVTEQISFPAWIQSGDGHYAVLDIDFVNDRAWTEPTQPSISSLLTCTRASPGYYTNADGTLSLFGSAARVNSLKHSQALANADWTDDNVTVTDNAVAAPDGTTTASRVIESVGAGNHRVYQFITTATPNAVSLYIKQTGTGALRYLYIELTGGIGATFDPSTGTVTHSLASGAGVLWGATMTDAGSGWYRCCVFGVGEANPGVLLALADSPTNGLNTPSYTGDGVSGLLMWGAQCELAGATAAWNQPFPSAYIPTTTAAVTVAAVNDVLRYGDQGLLVEGSRTNLCLQSQAFDNTWYIANGTGTANQTAAPDGTLTADLFTADGSSDGANFYQPVTITTAVYTWSVYVKQGTAAYAWINAYDGGNNKSWFKLSDGTVGTNAAGNTSTIASLANGWYRIAVTRTAASSVGYAVIGFSDADNADPITAGKTGYAWGYQLELGSSASSYIPTTSASVTRANDEVFATYDWRETGTAYAQFNTPSFGTDIRVVTAAGNPTFASPILSSGSGVKIYASGNQATTGNAYTVNTTAQSAAAYNAAGNAICLNGGTVATDASDISADFNGATQLGLGYDLQGGSFLYGYILRVTLWLPRLSDATLQSLTTP